MHQPKQGGGSPENRVSRTGRPSRFRSRHGLRIVAGTEHAPRPNLPTQLREGAAQVPGRVRDGLRAAEDTARELLTEPVDLAFQNSGTSPGKTPPDVSKLIERARQSTTAEPPLRFPTPAGGSGGERTHKRLRRLRNGVLATLATLGTLVGAQGVPQVRQAEGEIGQGIVSVFQGQDSLLPLNPSAATNGQVRVGLRGMTIPEKETWLKAFYARENQSALNKAWFNSAEGRSVINQPINVRPYGSQPQFSIAPGEQVPYNYGANYDFYATDIVSATVDPHDKNLVDITVATGNGASTIMKMDYSQLYFVLSRNPDGTPIVSTTGPYYQSNFPSPAGGGEATRPQTAQDAVAVLNAYATAMRQVQQGNGVVKGENTVALIMLNKGNTLANPGTLAQIYLPDDAAMIVTGK